MKNNDFWNIFTGGFRRFFPFARLRTGPGPDVRKGKKLLVVIDVQNDFITGVLAAPGASRIIPRINEKLAEGADDPNRAVVFTRDIHSPVRFGQTREGRFLPPHCIDGTFGAEFPRELKYQSVPNAFFLQKDTFGSLRLCELAARIGVREIELVGVCTDICVIANALLLKTKLPEIPIAVDSSCCAGTSDDNHRSALAVMKNCQINVI